MGNLLDVIIKIEEYREKNQKEMKHLKGFYVRVDSVGGDERLKMILGENNISEGNYIFISNEVIVKAYETYMKNKELAEKKGLTPLDDKFAIEFNTYPMEKETFDGLDKSIKGSICYSTKKLTNKNEKFRHNSEVMMQTLAKPTVVNGSIAKKINVSDPVLALELSYPMYSGIEREVERRKKIEEKKRQYEEMHKKQKENKRKDDEMTL